MYDRSEALARQRLLWGDEACDRLAHAGAAVFGLGGVGSWAVEALARAGVGRLVLVDFDTVSVSNINRQLCALHSTVGRNKAEVLAERFADIDPLCELTVHTEKITEENAAQLIGKVDFLADAVDDMRAKVALIHYAKTSSIPVISAMGAGRKRNPMRLQITDISKTHTCPLARNLRRELRLLGIEEGVKVAFSDEKPVVTEHGVQTLGSIIFVPSVMGLLMAHSIVEDIAARG